MKILFSVLVTLIALSGVVIKPLRKYRTKILIAYAVMIVLLSFLYNQRTRELMLPFYSTGNQHFYQTEFLEGGEYPDSLLPYILENKTVVMATYFDWTGTADSLETWYCWKNGTMHRMNIQKLFEHCGAKVEITGPKVIVDDDSRDLYSWIGYLNDSLRYTFMYNDIKSEFGNSFYYYWCYGTVMEPFGLYICDKDIKESDTLYLFMDMNSNLYLISKEYYDSEVAKR